MFIEDGFNVSYLHRPNWPADATEILNDKLQEALDHDRVTDGGIILGF